MSNLPNLDNRSVKDLFNATFSNTLSFPAGEIDAVVGFFLKRGFDQSSANSITIILLNQARVDNVNVFELVDTLKKLPTAQLSQVVAQVLNTTRQKTSLLGFRTAVIDNDFESRNIVV